MDQATIEELRQSIDIVPIISEVVSLQRRGQNYFGLCPFHQEKSPSFSVSSQKQLFHCFGCKAGGDVIKFYQLYHRMDFTQAVEELARRAGMTIRSLHRDETWNESLEILEAVTGFFEETLAHPQRGEKARQYLKLRKIPERLWQEFRLGAHPGGPEDVSEFLKSKGLSRDIAAQLGILGRSENAQLYDKFRGRLIFSIADDQGKTRGFGSRNLGDSGAKYINSPSSKIFNKKTLLYGMHLANEAIRRNSYAILVEGYLDVMALHEFGVRNAVGSMGTALNQDQIRKIKRWTSRVLSLYDADEAGVAATERNLEQFMMEGIEVKVAVIPDAKDPDGLLHDESVSRELREKSLKTLIRSAKPALDFLIESRIGSQKDSIKRAHATRELVALLDKIPDALEAAVLKKEVARKFGLPLELFGLDPAQAPTPNRPSQRVPKALKKATDWEAEVLKFLVVWGNKLELSLMAILPYLDNSSKWSKVLKDLMHLGLEPKEIAGLNWLGEQPEDIQQEVREWIINQEEVQSLVQEVDLNEIWLDLVSRLRNAFFKSENHRLQFEIEAAESNKDDERMRQLLIEKKDLIELLKNQSAETSL
ncbi:MAG: DNA primase [Deltaproteobacteria bacterium CG11_big_fil_rev_8_21_14_0_20_45_16]|nr:MAG: DNA primase [Deltaproteobacteria bacterium CG11_big_fil_rev_8_21_14_0_20_45_16]